MESEKPKFISQSQLDFVEEYGTDTQKAFAKVVIFFFEASEALASVIDKNGVCKVCEAINDHYSDCKVGQALQLAYEMGYVASLVVEEGQA